VTVVVLGASGFLGSDLFQLLSDMGMHPVSVGRSTSNMRRCDVLDRDALRTSLLDLQPTTVISLIGAGLSDSSVNEALVTQANTHFPQDLLLTLHELNPDAHLIHAASSTEEPNTQGEYESSYSRAKAEGSKALRRLQALHGGNLTILNVHNTYGHRQPGNRFVSSVIDRLSTGRDVSLHYPARVRDFVHVSDVSRAFLASAQAPVKGVEEYEVGTGVGTSLESVSLTIAGLVGADAGLVHRDSRTDTHSWTVASTSRLLVAPEVDLVSGLERTVRERLEE